VLNEVVGDVVTVDLREVTDDIDNATVLPDIEHGGDIAERVVGIDEHGGLV